MVGSRSPTRVGIANAQRLSGQLSSLGLTIVSGMVLGIDAACHEGALLAGAKTIAVLGTGCDIVYPARYQGLAHEISRLGLLLSEFPVRVRAAPHHFPRRNLVVTGFSLGTIVVEAVLKSGSLISAGVPWSRVARSLRFRVLETTGKPEVAISSLEMVLP